MDETKYIRTESADGVVTFTPIKRGQAKSWEELDEISGWYVNENSEVKSADQYCAIDPENENIWATKEQAGAALAMSQLSQLMARANDGWVPDLGRESFNEVIKIREGMVVGLCAQVFRSFLAFETREIRDEFLELHRDLIEQAKPLL